jgi:hypothetical protein
MLEFLLKLKQLVFQHLGGCYEAAKNKPGVPVNSKHSPHKDPGRVLGAKAATLALPWPLVLAPDPSYDRNCRG